MSGSEITKTGEATQPVVSGSQPPPQLSDAEKAAIVLAAIGPEGSASILGAMDHGRVRKFARTIAMLRRIDARTVEAVIDEFLGLLTEEEGVAGGPETSRRFLAEFLEDKRIDVIMQDIGAAPETVWKALAELDDEQILDWLSGEHPQVIAITLANIPSAKSARILERLAPEQAQDIVLRMSAATSVAPEIVEQIKRVIAEEVLPIARMKAQNQDPASLIATVMNHVSGEVRDSVLGRMETASPELEREVRRIMFTYQDIPQRIAPRDVGAIIKATDEAVLLRALKHGEAASPQVGEFLLANITNRLADRMRDDIADLKQPSRKDGEAAQAALIASITRLQASGAIEFVELE